MPIFIHRFSMNMTAESRDFASSALDEFVASVDTLGSDEIELHTVSRNSTLLMRLFS